MNQSITYIQESHSIDTELATECLGSEKTTIEDKRDAVRELITQKILLRAFNERNIAKSYRGLSRSRDRNALARKAKQLISNNSYIAEITEWYARAYEMTDEYMPSISEICRSTRKEMPGIIQALFERLPETQPALEELAHPEMQNFLDEVKDDEFELEKEFEAYLQRKDERKVAKRNKHSAE